MPPPQKIFQFWGLERRILVHSVALLSADCTASFCTVFTVQMQLALIRYVNAPNSRAVLLHYYYVGKSITLLMVNL